MKYFINLLILLSMCACASNKNKSSIHTYWICENRGDCQNENAAHCLLVQRNETCDEKKWSIFKNEIIGFNYELGTRYNIEVKEDMDNTQENISKTFTLVKIISTEVKQTPQTSVNMRLHDIWALESIQGKIIDKKALNKRPMIEIHLQDKNIMGNDGCNNIRGSIINIDAEKIVFGPIMGTKMACPNMEISYLFNEQMSNVQYYKLENLKLKFYNQDKKEILSFIKID